MHRGGAPLAGEASQLHATDRPKPQLIESRCSTRIARCSASDEGVRSCASRIIAASTRRRHSTVTPPLLPLTAVPPASDLPQHAERWPRTTAPSPTRLQPTNPVDPTSPTVRANASSDFFARRNNHWDGPPAHRTVARQMSARSLRRTRLPRACHNEPAGQAQLLVDLSGDHFLGTPSTRFGRSAPEVSKARRLLDRSF